MPLMEENIGIISASFEIFNDNDISAKIIRQDAYYERCYRRAIQEVEHLQFKRMASKTGTDEPFSDEIISDDELGSF
jgi:hypothetical protein